MGAAAGQGWAGGWAGAAEGAAGQPMIRKARRRKGGSQLEAGEAVARYLVKVLHQLGLRAAAGLILVEKLLYLTGYGQQRAPEGGRGGGGGR